MRITLPSGTPAELARFGDDPRAGLVIAPDIFGLRPLFDDLCQRIALEQGYSVVAVEPFPGLDLGSDVEVRQDTVGELDDAAVLRDLVEGAEATGCERVGLIGFCMGGMYALKAAGLGTFRRIVSFYGMIRVPARWNSPGRASPSTSSPARARRGCWRSSACATRTRRRPTSTRWPRCHR